MCSVIYSLHYKHLELHSAAFVSPGKKNRKQEIRLLSAWDGIKTQHRFMCLKQSHLPTRSLQIGKQHKGGGGGGVPADRHLWFFLFYHLAPPPSNPSNVTCARFRMTFFLSGGGCWLSCVLSWVCHCLKHVLSGWRRMLCENARTDCISHLQGNIIRQVHTDSSPYFASIWCLEIRNCRSKH